MEELKINYAGSSETRRITNIITGGFLATFTLYFCVSNAIANTYGILFFCALIGFILSAISVLNNTVWQPKDLLKISSVSVESNLPKQNKTAIDWTSVSRVNIGISYLVFLTNGEKKQSKLDLSGLVYEDVLKVKGKVIELCEYKNIPYQND